MRYAGDGLLVSPSDLNGYLACAHLTSLDLRLARGEPLRPAPPRPDAKLIADRGLAHERRFLERLRAEGRDVATIPAGDAAAAAARTAEAMRDGREVVYQAGFAAGRWRGYADFLLRVDEPSDLGAWSYEPCDAKLAVDPRPYFIFQLLFYAEQVAALQGRLPDRMHLLLGTREQRSFRPRDFAAYGARVRARFLDALAAYEAGAEPPYPYPVEHCHYCRWWRRCADRRRTDDHLSLVAFLTRGQAKRLEAAGVSTVAELAALPDGTHVPRVAGATLTTLRGQAGLQVASRGAPRPALELLAPSPERGFARLPAPSPGDVFFDIEGDPYWGDDGLEYLLGSLTVDGRYRPSWAHDRDGERASFEAWVDWITARLAEHPDLHVYHYNHYEPTAVKKLMARYGAREDEVDELLRRRVFVDLYAVVRQALRIGTESYSLKAVEALYAFERDAEVTEAGGSILAYQEYLDSGERSRLDAIAAYNADDCRSTLALRDWLLDRRAQAERVFGVAIAALERPAPRAPSEETAAALAEVALLERALAGVEPARRLMADLLHYHRREARPQWWAYFDRVSRSPDELRDDDAEALGDLAPAPAVPRRERARSWLIPLSFPPQQHKLEPGGAVDPATESAVTIERVEDGAGLVWISRAKAGAERPLPRALIPPPPIRQTDQQTALRTLAARVRDRGLEPCGELDAACDLLARRPPRLGAGAPPLAGGPVDVPALCEQVAALDSSALVVQGPPGSGKTWTGARLIVHLLRAGRRVGVAATSHKAIHNLLDAVEAHAAETGVTFAGMKKASAGHAESEYASAHVRSSTAVADFPPGDDVALIAGTGWLWSRAALRASVDVLFVDEAGQVSLADALAMAQGARSVVLLGDPQQLAHVSQGVHPRASGVSVLEHVLDGLDTVPPGRGVFLETTFRMHPDVCRFVSEEMYDGRLRSRSGCERQRIAARGVRGAGVRLLAVEHADNRQSAGEEAERIAAELALLLDGGTFTDAYGRTRPLTLADVLVVAPYNAQVRCLRAALPAGARIGTVDRFQGQEAPVVLFSMTSSSGEDVPRGMDFLFSRNRLNVAVSRARALAVVVCSPRLLWARCATVEQMRLVNALCRFADEAARVESQER